MEIDYGAKSADLEAFPLWTRSLSACILLTQANLAVSPLGWLLVLAAAPC